MSKQRLYITVYGRKQISASCAGTPGSLDTYEWLQAAIQRKYMDIHFTYEYIDIDNDEQVRHKEMIEQSKEMFYPLVLLNDDIIAEGIPQLKTIYRAIDEHIM